MEKSFLEKIVSIIYNKNSYGGNYESNSRESQKASSYNARGKGHKAYYRPDQRDAVQHDTDRRAGLYLSGSV